MVRFGLFGCGRIGQMHAANLVAHPKADLRVVYDVHAPAANEVAQKYGVSASNSIGELLARGDIDAVLIASSTDTHCDLITSSTTAGKAILCEKPIDLSSERVEACWKTIEALSPRIMIGFNRRFDPSFASIKRRVVEGEIGALHQVIITSRDPEVPPIGYMKVAGGILRDMTIHDFDLARFLLGEEPRRVTCFAQALLSEDVRSLNDHDTAMILLETASGRMCCINNHRRAVYGYDQRIEVIGSDGMLQADNKRPTTVLNFTESATASQDPLPYFFIERYQDAYRLELDEFIAAVEEDREPSVGYDDGRRALNLADAAYRSLETGRVAEVD